MAQIYTNTTTAREMDRLKWIRETFPEGVFRTQDIRFSPEVYRRWRDWPMILDRLRKKEWVILLTKTYFTLDPLSPPTGKRTYRWKLLLNVSDQALLDMAEGIY